MDGLYFFVESNIYYVCIVFIVYMLTITHYENQDSDLFDIKIGMPQRSILGYIYFQYLHKRSS